MINSIISGLVSFIANLGAIYTAPVNAVITTFFPDITNLLNMITTILSYITGTLSWFVYLIPPTTRGLILFILTFWVGVWPTRVVIWNVSFGLNFIKRLNIFSSK